jgi:hypothetical protein
LLFAKDFSFLLVLIIQQTYNLFLVYQLSFIYFNIILTLYNNFNQIYLLVKLLFWWVILFLYICLMTKYTYKAFKEGVWHIYSDEYTSLKDCLLWYLKNGRFVESISNRNLVLFKGSKKVKTN